MPLAGRGPLPRRVTLHPLAGDTRRPEPSGDRAEFPRPTARPRHRKSARPTPWKSSGRRTCRTRSTKARSQVTVDPGKAEAMIQQKTSDLTAVAELRPEMRDRLMGMLRPRAGKSSIARRSSFIREQQRIREEADRREREMTNEALQQDQKKVKQLMDRFDSLMAEGRHRLAEESAALEAAEDCRPLLCRRRRPTMSSPARTRCASRAPTTTSWRSALPRQKGFVDCHVSDRKVARPRSRRPADRLSGRRNLEGTHGTPQGKVQRHGPLAATARPRRRSKRP